MYLRNVSVSVYLIQGAEYAWFRAIANYKELFTNLESACTVHFVGFWYV